LPHWRKRHVIPLVLLGLILAGVGGIVVRGTWADTEPRNPESSADGIICRLYRPPQGDWQVRCAMVLDHPPEKVWGTITDYKNFADIFSTLETAESERLAPGRTRLYGLAHSPIGTWPYDIVVEEETSPDLWMAHWDGKSGNVQRIVGGWTVTPAGQGKTLLVYSSHVEIKLYPDWLVVNAMLARQPKVMKAVADWLARK
jgi:hypothetical protein